MSRDYDNIGRIRVGHDSGRYTLEGIPLRSGNRIELQSNGYSWIPVRWDYDLGGCDPPTLTTDEGEVIELRRKHLLRWPLPKSRLGKWFWRFTHKY